MTTINTPADAEVVSIASIQPSPENDQIYHPIQTDDPGFVAMVESVRDRGILEPIIADCDGWIISGHRRFAAAIAAGLTEVPVRTLNDVSREDDIEGFVRLLREHNRQREKTFDERVREELASVDSADAYEHLQEYRRQNSGMVEFSSEALVIGEPRRRCLISKAKKPMLDAIKKIIEGNRDYWPLSDRSIHYAILNNPPLRHASKPDSVYINDDKSYDSLTELLTRARLSGFVSWDAIADETRSFTNWLTWQSPGTFVGDQTNKFMKGYWRDLMQSQPNHIEIIAEKLTIRTVVERVAQDFTIPVTIGRGFCSIQPRHDLMKRFNRSGRDRLVLLFLSDFDPDGESIAESYARSIRDDFELAACKIHPVKVALTAEQVKRFRLPKSGKAKKTSSRYKEFVKKHGTAVWELEALPLATLADELRQTINQVIDIEAYEHEREQEVIDARQLEGRRRASLKMLGESS
jgi:ParB-like nuclease domain